MTRGASRRADEVALMVELMTYTQNARARHGMLHWFVELIACFWRHGIDRPPAAVVARALQLAGHRADLLEEKKPKAIKPTKKTRAAARKFVNDLIRECAGGSAK